MKSCIKINYNMHYGIISYNYQNILRHKYSDEHDWNKLRDLEIIRWAKEYKSYHIFQKFNSHTNIIVIFCYNILN